MNRVKALLLGVCILVLSCAGFAVTAGLGELDATFGENGRVATALGHYGDQAYALAVQTDGRILAAGSSSNGANLDFAVVRYTRKGELDSSFGLDGVVTTMVGREDDEIAAIAVQDDGYIVAAGYALTEGGKDFALVRYTPDGLPDHSFGLGGIVITGYSGLDDELTALAVDGEGRLVAAGYTTGTAGRAVIVARYLSSGNLDVSFGDRGVSLIGIGQDAIARSIAVDAEGRILVAGSFLLQKQSEVMVLRLDFEGELDPSFGEDGMNAPLATDRPTDGYGLALLDDGSILVAGATGTPGMLDAALFRFTGQGQPDATFGEGGLLVTEASEEDDVAMAVAARGNMVSLSGFSTVNGGRQFLFISHLLADPENARVSFALKGKRGTTGLRINERQDMASARNFQNSADEASAYPLETVVNTTQFGGSDEVSYAVAAQPDGRAVVAGLTEQGGTTSFALARYAMTSAATNSLGVSWIATKEPSEVTPTTAFTGGVIGDTSLTISQRGVVFSIAPDPTLDEGTGTPDTPPDGTDTTPPSVLSTNPKSGASNVALNSDVTITWNESIDCTTVNTSSVTSTSSGWTKKDCSGSQAVFGTSGQNISQQYSVTVSTAVADAAGNKMASAYTFSYTTAATTTDATLRRVEQYAGAVGDLLVGTAHAQTLPDDNTNGNTTTTTSVFKLSSPEYVNEGFTKDGAGTGSYSSILEKLKPSTFYYVRAYAKTSTGDVYYGNQIGLKTSDACFIATAAYGSLLHPFVGQLRAVRDRYLQTSSLGQMFVRFYYQHSPPLAAYIASHPVLRPVVQAALLPAIGLSWLLLHLGAGGLLILGGTAGLVGWQTRRFTVLEKARLS